MQPVQRPINLYATMGYRTSKGDEGGTLFQEEVLAAAPLAVVSVNVAQKGKGSSPKADCRTQDLEFYEFFAGGGMARAGLGNGWKCNFANDFDFKKSITYNENWGKGALLTRDVGSIKTTDLPGTPDFVWASFPCQDLSLAGMGAGLQGDRSGTFWPFWRLMQQLSAEGRGPKMVVLENVCGTLTSHGGKDFSAIAGALANAGYHYGAVVLDAAEFVPHSRPRLFVVAVRNGIPIPQSLVCNGPDPLRHTKALRDAFIGLTPGIKAQWVWWNVPMAEKRRTSFADLIEEDPSSVRWHSAAETKGLLQMMSPLNRHKVLAAQRSGRRMVGTIYKRTRANGFGEKVQRAEVRFDNIAGCLRTPAGGSSRQIILVVEGKDVRSRLISSRETARLMGLPESYKLPENYNEAYHLTGDGVAVPVVRHLAKTLFEPILSA